MFIPIEDLLKSSLPRRRSAKVRLLYGGILFPFFLWKVTWILLFHTEDLLRFSIHGGILFQKYIPLWERPTFFKEDFLNCFFHWKTYWSLYVLWKSCWDLLGLVLPYWIWRPLSWGRFFKEVFYSSIILLTRKGFLFSMRNSFHFFIGWRPEVFYYLWKPIWGKSCWGLLGLFLLHWIWRSLFQRRDLLGNIFCMEVLYSRSILLTIIPELLFFLWKARLSFFLWMVFRGLLFGSLAGVS